MAQPSGQHTYTEIISQADAWQSALEAFSHSATAVRTAWASANPRQIIVTGCGSTHYLSMTAASLIQGLTGVPARALPASEIVLFFNHTIARPQETLLLAISRSGTTTETVRAIEKFRQHSGGAVWGITCYGDSPVGEESDLALLAEAAQEQSVAQTRSFSSMLLLAQALAATVGGQDASLLHPAPALARQLLAEIAAPMAALGGRLDLTRAFFLGAGPLYGVACEAMLKMKEMSLTDSEAYHFMEFRHGPKSMVDPSTLIVGLLGPTAFMHEQSVLSEVAELGGHTLALFPAHLKAMAGVPFGPQTPLPGSLPAWAQPVLYLPALQLLAYHRAVQKGLDPDRPRHLDAVVYLDAAALADA